MSDINIQTIFPAPSSMKKKGILGWLVPILKLRMAGNTDTTHHHIQQFFSDQTESYIRIQAGLYDGDEDMANGSEKNLQALEEAGKRKVIEHKTKLDEIVDLLIENHYAPISDHSQHILDKIA